MGAGCSCGFPKTVATHPEDDRWYESSSSDEECGVPPVPVGSDDGTVLFYWANETPRHARQGDSTSAEAPEEDDEEKYAEGDAVKYLGLIRAEVVAVLRGHDEHIVQYTICLPSGERKDVVGGHLAPWTEDSVSPPKLQPIKKLPSLLLSTEDGPGPSAPSVAGEMWSHNESSVSKPKRKGLRFEEEPDIHEIDKERAANTHLSLEKPLNLPMVPPNSMQSGMWNMPMQEQPQDGHHEDEDEDEDEQRPEHDENPEGEYDPITGFAT